MNIIPFNESHFSELCRWFNSESELVQWGGPDLMFPLDPAQLSAMLAEAATAPPARWLFIAMVDGAPAAHAQVALDWRNGVARLARVAVNPALRGQGLAAPFLQRLVDLVFASSEFERLELNVYTFNQTAIRTYAGLGFKEEGVRRSSVKVGAQRWDTAIYAILRAEYAS